MDSYEQSVQLQLWSFVRKDKASRVYRFLVVQHTPHTYWCEPPGTDSHYQGAFLELF